MRWGTAIAFALGVTLSLPAFAVTVATVQTMEGSLSLNRGEGYVEILTWADAQAGSQVMANPGSWGKIIYSDGCDVTVKPGSVYTIQDASPCLSGRIGGSATTYVLGGVAIAAGVVGIVVLTNGDDDKKGGKKKASDDDQPASP
jgi:hypothetical protein